MRMFAGVKGMYVPSAARNRPGNHSTPPSLPGLGSFEARATWMPTAVPTGVAGASAIRPGTARSHATRLSSTFCSRWVEFPFVAFASRVRLTLRSISESTSKGTLNGSPV
jgi:hypothetical protein